MDKLKTLKALWDFLSGKKTTIGAILMLIAQVVGMLGYSEWKPVIETLIEILMDAGVITAAVGLTHKAVKK